MQNRFMSDAACVERLRKTYEDHNSIIVAFDFDDTIFDYHGNGDDYSDVIKLLRVCGKLGFTLILFTTENNPDKLNWKKSFCDKERINVDYVNESPLFHPSGKPYYNILLDDKAGLGQAYNILYRLVTEILMDASIEELEQS